MKKYFGKLIIVGLCILVATLSIHINQAMAGSKAKTLTLAHIAPLSGRMALYGQDSRRSVILAMEEINAKGGITVAGQRYTIDIIHLDNKYKADEGMAALNRAADLEKVHFVHGAGTPAHLAWMQVNEKKNVLIDCNTYVSKITQTGNKLLLSQPAMSNGFEPPVAKEATKRGLKTMAIIADSGEMGRDVTPVMKKNYEELGGKVIGTEFVHTMTATDFYPVVTKMKSLDADCIYIIAPDEQSGCIAKQIREVGYTKTLVFQANFKDAGMKIVGMKDIEGSFMAGSPTSVLCTAPPGTPKRYLEMRDSYMKRWPGETMAPAGGYAYNWLYFITRAMEIAGTTTDPYAVREAVNKAVAENDFLFGIKGFTKGGRAYGHPVFVLGIKDGKVQIIDKYPYPKELAAEGEK